MLETNKIYLRITLAACLATAVTASWWDDFTNNLATDLTPLIALFGEQATKQFLSESTTVLDNFLFAMAPLGILTGVVSAIRVCGGPSLRAFIGRAQEGGGIAEAELCSSTSRDVCELYHNGAIVRVFGRPKILEIVYDPALEKNESSDEKHELGINLSREYFQKSIQKDTCWEEDGTDFIDDEAKNGLPPTENIHDNFAPNPNLSLNVGIVKRHPYIYIGAAIIGFLAQASVLVSGAVVTYKLRWAKNGSSIDPWAFPFMFAGTACVCVGMFLCATLVNDSTKERLFRRKSTQNWQNGTPSPILYVVQPGNQVVGDQTFDPFLFFSSTKFPFESYMTSWKAPPSNSRINSEQGSSTSQKERRLSQRLSGEFLVLVAAFITTLGFILQFVGLRAMHSIISLLQLAVTLLMSIIRALLRTQRLSIDENVLRDRPDEVSGHELDWLALQVGKGVDEPRYSWSVTTAEVPVQDSQSTLAAYAETAWKYRSRLAELTGQSKSDKSRLSNAWDNNLVSGRVQAQQLKKVIEDSIAIFFTHAKQKVDIQNTKIIPWSLNVAVGEYSKRPHQIPAYHRISVPLREQDSVWTVDQNLLEAMIGLWSWSIVSDPCTEGETFGLKTSTASDIPVFRIIAAGTGNEVDQAWREVQFWIGGPSIPLSTFTKRGQPLSDLDTNSTTIWQQGKPIMIHQNDSSTPIPLFGKSDPYQRLFGWHCIDTRKEPTIAAIRIKSSNLPTFCTQDIYQSFLCTITAYFDLDKERTIATKERNTLRLEHQLVTKLIDCFEARGLGSRQDAFLVIIPTLRNHSVLPRAANALPTAYRTAEDLRKGNNFREAEGVLQWAWGVMSESGGPRDATMIELGELYRYALFQDSWQAFGKDGIKWMDAQKDSSLLSEEEKAVIARYVALEKRPRESRTGQQFLDAILRRDRGEALWSISQLEHGDLPVDGKSGRAVLSFLSQHGWLELVQAVLEIGSVVGSVDKQGRTPLTYAAEHGHVTIVSILMEASSLPITEDSSRRTPLSYAAGGGHVPVMERLLSDPRVNIYAKDIQNRSPLHWAAINGRHDAIKSLIDHGARVDDVDSNERTPLLAALSNIGRRRLDRRQTADLLVRMKSKVDITIQNMQAWEWALRNGEFVCAEFLLENHESRENMGILVDIGGRCMKFPISLPQDFQYGFRIRTFDDRHKEKEVTMKDIQEVAAGKYYVRINCVINGFEECGIPSEKSYKIIDMLLDGLQGVGVIEEVIEAAATNRTKGKEIISMLLDRHENIRITEEVVKAAVANEQSGTEILALLLNQQGECVPITQSAVTLITENFNIKLMALLLSRCGEQVQITEEVLQAAARNKFNGGEIITLLFEQQGDQFRITKEMLLAAARNELCGEKVMTLFLEWRGDQVKITKEVLLAAAGNVYGDKIMKLLLDRRGEQVKITEDVVKIIAGNPYGDEIMKLLLDRRGEQVQITAEIVKITIENEDGQRLMKLLLDRREEQVQITEELAKALPENWTYARYRITELLNQRKKQG